MAENRKKRPKKIPSWTNPDEKRPFVHSKLFKPDEDETLLIRKNNVKIK